MRKFLLVAGLAAATALPGLASAETCHDQKNDNRAVGTVLGAGLGALLGNSISGRGSKTAGTIVGGVGGAVVGNAVGGSSVNCARTGYYDRDGVWHASNNGYYDSNGVWRSNANGYYDSRGRWVASNSTGYYDTNGNWISTAPSGYYDRYGRWVVTAPAAGNYNADVSYTGRDIWYGAPTALDSRETWLNNRIRNARDSGVISHSDASRAYSELRNIRDREAQMRADNDGTLSYDQRVYLQGRLDTLSNSIRWDGGY